MMSVLDVCHVMAVFQCLLHWASMAKLTHSVDYTLKFLYKSQNPHNVYFGELRAPEMQVWARLSIEC